MQNQTIKVGIDLVSDKRIRNNLTNKIFLNKIFHPSEQKLTNKLASIFALKECVFKALSISSQNWLEIEILYNKDGKPSVHLSNQIKPHNLISIDCSVTHENELTQGIVILLLKEEQ